MLNPDQGESPMFDTTECKVPLKSLKKELSGIMKKGGYIGVDCGVEGLGDFLNFREGEFTIVTGYSGSGKSEFIDSVYMGLAENQNWITAFCSMEKTFAQHVYSLLHKKLACSPKKASKDDRKKAMEFLEETLVLLDYNKLKKNLEDILSFVKSFQFEEPINMLVIDPFNHLKHLPSESLYDKIQNMSTLLHDFALETGIHVVLVAHPKTPPTAFGKKMPRCTAHSIAGGSDFKNIADNVIVVHRSGKDVSVTIEKVRWQGPDTEGEVYLSFDTKTKKYIQQEQIENGEF